MGVRKKLEGTTINNLFVEQYIGGNKYLCTCMICGGKRECRGYELGIGKYKACRSCETEAKKNNDKTADIIGTIIGSWEILHRDETNAKKLVCRYAIESSACLRLT